MKRLFICLALLSVLQISHAQEWYWRTRVLGFADNREYRSSVQVDQTLLGIQFAPEVAVVFDTLHSLNIGFNALKEFGSTNESYTFIPYFYYGFSGAKFNFDFGIFPRSGFLDQSHRILYNDSLRYYRPYISGLHWTYKVEKFRQSLYLDWTGRQTDTLRETFIMGTQGKLNIGSFFVHNHLYMYHYAFAGIRPPGSSMRDNGVALLTLGVDLARFTPLDTLVVSYSRIQSYERDRRVGKWETPVGSIFEFSVGYKGFLFSNTFYYGQGHRLDWGDPFYRLKKYNRSDLGYSFLRYKNVSGSFVYSIHFAEEKVGHQQQFVLTVDLGKKF